MEQVRDLVIRAADAHSNRNQRLRAFGIGLERLAMLKYGITDIRDLWRPPHVP
jgi:phenylalanyl-tRNA synthetase alpha subunit